MELSDSQIEQIAAKVAENLKHDGHTHCDRHVEHHEWIEQRIKDQADFRQFRKKIIESASIWAAIGFLGFLTYFCWRTLVTIIKSGNVVS